MDLDLAMTYAGTLEEKGQYEQALEVYLALIGLGDELNKERKGEVFFRAGLQAFRGGMYEQALHMFIQSYQLEYSQKEILELLDEAYYLPNRIQFEQTYRQNLHTLLQKYPDFTPVPFDQLPFRFYPLSEQKYYIYDQRLKQFFSLFSREDDTCPDIAAQDILLTGNQYNDKKLLRYKELAEESNSLIYIVFDPVIMFLSYLSVIDIQEILECDNIKLFFSLAELSVYCKNNEALRPKTLFDMTLDERYGLEYFLAEEIKASSASPPASNDELQRLLVGHRFLEPESPEILLSVCIPTYNRGARALENVRHCLKLPANLPVEIVVSDNGSPDDDGKYREISEIADPRLRYHRNELNIGFARNILKVIELAHGQYIYLISDEDFVNLEAVPSLLQILENCSEESIVRGSISPVSPEMPRANSCQCKDTLLSPEDALTKYALKNTYISGTIYNRRIIRTSEIFARVWENIDQHLIYPHLYLDALLCTQGKVRLLAEVICLEGKDEFPIGDPALFGRGPGYSFEARLAQHKLFSGIVSEVADICGANQALAAKMYVNLCMFMFVMISQVNGPYYVLNGRDLSKLLERTARYFLDMYSTMCTDQSLYEPTCVLIKAMYKQIVHDIVEKYPALSYMEEELRSVEFLK